MCLSHLEQYHDLIVLVFCFFWQLYSIHFPFWKTSFWTEFLALVSKQFLYFDHAMVSNNAANKASSWYVKAGAKYVYVDPFACVPH